MLPGEKLKLARLAAGMSQRQLCGDVITRNMLSLIENGAATPSVSTLQFLASRLGYPVSYFLEEEPAVSSNTACMNAAWRSFDEKDYAGVLSRLQNYNSPDPLHEKEFEILSVLSLLNRADALVQEEKVLYARQLLREAEKYEQIYQVIPDLKNRLICLRSLVDDLPKEVHFHGLDEMLLVQARIELKNGNFDRAGKLLDAVSNQQSPGWNYLRGETAVKRGDFRTAISYLHRSEPEYPKEANALLEQCYKELGDYKNAYLCACKERLYDR